MIEKMKPYIYTLIIFSIFIGILLSVIYAALPGGFSKGYKVDYGIVAKVNVCSHTTFFNPTRCRVTLEGGNRRTVHELVAVGDVLEVTCYEPNNKKCYRLRVKR